jgi:ribonuclease P protein component
VTNKADFSLPRRAIIRRQEEINRLFRRGQKHNLNGFTLFLRKAEETRVGFIVRKDVGSAVLRNRHKRWLRENYRLLQHSFAGYEALFYVSARQLQAQQDFNHYRQELLAFIGGWP